MDNVFICEPRNLPAHKIYSKIEIINRSTDTYKQHIYDGLMWLFLFPRNWFNEIKKLSKLAISTVTDVKQYIMLLFIVKSWADWLVSDWKLLSAIWLCFYELCIYLHVQICREIVFGCIWNRVQFDYDNVNVRTIGNNVIIIWCPIY